MMLQQTLSFGLLFLMGYLGYLLFRLLHIPAAPLLASMVSTAFLQFLGWPTGFTDGALAFLCSVILGINMGKQIQADILARVATAARPIAVHVCGMLLVSLSCGFFLYLFANHYGKDLSLVNALVSTSTGGLSEMTVLGMSLNADIVLLVFFQLFRQVTFLSLLAYMPAITGRFVPMQSRSLSSPKMRALPAFERREYIFLVCSATIGGYLGMRIGMPAGALFGAMLFSGILAVILKKHYLCPTQVRVVAQIGLGLILGKRFDGGLLPIVSELLLPAVLVTAVMLIGCLLLALLLFKTTGYDLNTCLVCSAPAGMSQMASIAEESGADMLTAPLFHAARVIAVVTLYPWLVLYFIGM